MATVRKKQLALNSLLRYSCKVKCGETVVNFGGVKVEENIQEKKTKIKENRTKLYVYSYIYMDNR